MADESEQTLMVLGAVGRIDFVSHRVQRVDGVHTDTSLEAGAGELPEPPLHAILHHHVIGALRDVEESADPLPADRRFDRGEVGLLVGKIVGGGHGVDGGSDHRVIHRFANLFPEKVHPETSTAEAVDVLVAVVDRVLVTDWDGTLEGRFGCHRSPPISARA